MLFNVTDRKPNLLKGKQPNLKESSPLVIPTGPCGDECKSQHLIRPPLLIYRDKRYDSDSFSSEDFSFATNPNDVTSLTSSDWGDEACEIDKQKSQHVQLLFNAIDRMLFEPDCLKGYDLNDHPISLSGIRKKNLSLSTNPTSIDLASMQNLLPECQDWASRFPHFRLLGLQIYRPPPPPPPLPLQPSTPTSLPLTIQKSTLHSQNLQNRFIGRHPEVTRGFLGSPAVKEVPRVKIIQRDGVQEQKFGSALVIQGHRIPTPMNATTTWLSHSRVNWDRSRFKAFNLTTRTQNDLVSGNRNLLSTLPEEMGLERGRRPLSTSRSPPRPTNHWASSQIKTTTCRSPRRRTTRSRDPPVTKEALTRTLVEMLLTEALTALEDSTLQLNPSLNESKAITAKLTKSISNLSSRELEGEKGSRLSVTRDQFIPTKTPPPSRNRQRRSSESSKNLVLSGKSFHIPKGSSNTITRTASLSSNTFSHESQNTRFTTTWPVRSDVRRSPKSRLDSSMLSPINNGRLNISDGNTRSQTISTLPPIVMPVAKTHQRRRMPANEVALLPPLFNSTSHIARNYCYSTKVVFHHGDNAGQTTLVEHSSRLSQGKVNHSRSRSLAAKFSPHSSKATQIQYSVAISTQRQRPTDSIWSKIEQTGDQTRQSQLQQLAAEKKPEKRINKRLQRTQAQVNEVVDIMRVNIEKVLERDKNLSQLDDRADALQAGASQFEASAGKLKRKFWWRNCKILMVLCGILAVIAIVIIVTLTSEKRETGNMNGNSLLKSNVSTSLSPELPPFGKNDEFQKQPQHLLQGPLERQDQAQRSLLPAHSGSRSNRVLPHGQETILSFPPASPHHESPLPKSEIVPGMPEGMDIESDPIFEQVV